jgi:hypothetical protein
LWVSTVQRKRVSHGAAAAVVGVGSGGGSGRERCGEDGLEPGRWTQDPGPTVVCCDQISCKGLLHFFIHGYGCVWVLCAWYAR